MRNVGARFLFARKYYPCGIKNLRNNLRRKITGKNIMELYKRKICPARIKITFRVIFIRYRYFYSFVLVHFFLFLCTYFFCDFNLCCNLIVRFLVECNFHSSEKGKISYKAERLSNTQLSNTVITAYVMLTVHVMIAKFVITMVFFYRKISIFKTVSFIINLYFMLHHNKHHYYNVRRYYGVCSL